jgi:hypothetical protein
MRTAYTTVMRKHEGKWPFGDLSVGVSAVLKCFKGVKEM